MCSEMRRCPRHCWTGSRITAIFWKPATTATGSRTAPHSNHHRPPRRRRRPRTYPQREREVHEPGWVRSRWKWWVRFAWKSTALGQRCVLALLLLAQHLQHHVAGRNRLGDQEAEAFFLVTLSSMAASRNWWGTDSVATFRVWAVTSERLNHARSATRVRPLMSAKDSRCRRFAMPNALKKFIGIPCRCVCVSWQCDSVSLHGEGRWQRGCQELFDVEQDEHPVIDRSDGQQVVPIHVHVECGDRAQWLSLQR